MVVLIVITYLRTERDVSDVEKCSGVDWGLFAILIGVAVICAIAGLYLVLRDYFFKKKIGFPHVPGDLAMGPINITNLKVLAFVGAFFSSCFGVSGGLLYTAILPMIGLVP